MVNALPRNGCNDMRIIRKFTWFGIKISLFFIIIPFICMVCFSLNIGIARSVSESSRYHVDPQTVKEDDVAELVFADNKNLIRQTQGFHADQVVDGGSGAYDYTTFCGDTLYSPVVGSAVVTYNGLDGVYANNTMITITGEAGTATLLHGNYGFENENGVFEKIPVGTTVVGGVTPIGTNASNGNSTGCHAHINWKPSDKYIIEGQPLKRTDVQHTGQSGNYGSVLTSYDGVKLSMSHYVPTQGGTNCDSDCTTMASGDKVVNWTFGRNGIYAAACPQEWAFGTRFTVAGEVYECRDRGGYINCYDYGDYDPALKENADGQYCWVDLLGDSRGFSYGQRTPDWDFVK